jgi:hypothetical protein
MERERRPGKKTDNEEIERAINLLYELMQFNTQIEPTLWSSAFTFIIANGYKQCGYTYEEFRNTIHLGFEHYKYLFDEK